MREFFYPVDEKSDGLTVQEFLYEHGYSKRLVIRLKQTESGLTVQGRRVRSTTVLRRGDTLCTVMPEGSQRRTDAKIDIPILYEDEDMIVCDKPAGLACHRSGGHRDDTLEQAFEGGALRAVYRLDKDTSGLLVLAKHPLAAARLHTAVEKRYLSVAQGFFSQKKGAVEMPLLRRTPYEPKQIFDPAGLPARTVYRVLWEGEGRSAVLCRLMTGRMHQIRAHFAEVGHPLLGDAMYGGDCTLLSRQALHCAAIRLEHPVTGKELFFFSEVPTDLRTVLPESLCGKFIFPICTNSLKECL